MYHIGCLLTCLFEGFLFPQCQNMNICDSFPAIPFPTLFLFKTNTVKRLVQTPLHLLLWFSLESTPLRLHPHHSPSRPVGVIRGLHVAETADSHLSFHPVPPASDPDGHPLLQKTLPSLGLARLQLPARFSSYLPASPAQSTLLSSHAQHSPLFYSSVLTFSLWMVSASLRALNAICL